MVMKFHAIPGKRRKLLLFVAKVNVVEGQFSTYMKLDRTMKSSKTDSGHICRIIVSAVRKRIFPLNMYI